MSRRMETIEVSRYTLNFRYVLHGHHSIYTKYRRIATLVDEF
jgi:hypothetical protein